MKFYRIEDQIVFSDQALETGTELVANTTDAAGEKHVPVITVTDDEVSLPATDVTGTDTDGAKHGRAGKAVVPLIAAGAAAAVAALALILKLKRKKK